MLGLACVADSSRDCAPGTCPTRRNTETGSARSGCGPTGQGRGPADAGIDLVADVRDGGLWAIQAKAYDPSYWIRKADVDSFRSESGRPHFSFRLLIATTDHLGPTARRTLEPSASPSPTCCARSLNSPKLPGRPRWTTCGPGCLHAPSGTAGGVRDLPVLTTDRCRRSNGRSTPARSAAVKMGAGAAVAAPNGAVIGDAIGRAFRAGGIWTEVV